MKTRRIRIVNPVPGEARFTSEKRAAQHCSAKRARMTAAGELFFYDNSRVERYRHEVADDADYHIRQYRSGVVFWNGDTDPANRNKPGMVRS